MAEERQVIAYRLTPIFESDPSEGPMIQTAAIMSCMATGEILSGMGGGGDFLSPKVVDMLRGGGCTITKDEAPIMADRDELLREKITNAVAEWNRTPLPRRALRAMRDRWERDLVRFAEAYPLADWSRSDPASETYRNLATAIAEINGVIACTRVGEPDPTRKDYNHG